MNISIKSKLYTVLGLLVSLVVVLWGSGSVFINTLAENSGAIIKDNIRSVTYMQVMEKALFEMFLFQVNGGYTGTTESSQIQKAYEEARERFSAALTSQEQNITEAGEKALTLQLRNNFERMEAIYARSSDLGQAELKRTLTPVYQSLFQDLKQLTSMNTDAIHRKNEIAQNTASNVTIYMIVIGGVCTIIGLVMLLRFPGYILNPVQELTDRITEVANRNYDHNIDFDAGNEYQRLAEAFNRMSAKLKEYESSSLDQIMSEKRRVETIIHQMGDAVIGLDAKNHVLFVNDKADELIGLDNKKLTGKYAADIAAENDVFQKIMKAIRGEADSEIGYLKTGKNEEHYYSVEVIPVRHDAADGEKKDPNLGNIITLRNVTKFHELDKAKSNFISVVSHELKTPISSIGLSLRLMEDERVGVLNDEQRKLAENIRKDLQRMKNTTTDLLDLSKIETGNSRLDTEAVHPRDIVEYAYETMLLQADQGNIALNMEIADNLEKVKSDPRKTVWVLINLISNALRYTGAGGSIVIEAKQDKDSDFILFAVEDNGEGIDPEFVDKIFDKYFQIDSSEKDRTGSGLGLAISKEFIIAQGGKIWAESTPGSGTKISFILPKYVAQQ